LHGLHPRRGRYPGAQSLGLYGGNARAALNDLAIVAPDWLRQQVTADWFERYGTRIEESRLPKGEAQRYPYAEQIGADGLYEF
jgi:transposase